MRKLVGCTVAALLLGVSAAAPAAAQVREDSAVGSGTVPGLSFDFDARSGPSGENPTGTVRAALIDQPLISVGGRVTCLTVTGNRAVIGFDGSLGSTALNGFVAVVDGPTDTFELLLGVPVSTVCPSTLNAFVADLLSGNIVVTDAPPFPTTKDQCKNGGWRNFGPTFKNQGQCVSFVATGGKKQP